MEEKTKAFLGIPITSVTSVFILLIILALPLGIYKIITTGSNNFIKLDIVGEKDPLTNKDHTIADFSFVNQYGDMVNNNSMNGNIYIADFFFANCPSICPIMTKNMAYVQKTLSKEVKSQKVKFLSYTVDPKNDTPDRFLQYIEEMRQKNVFIDLENWDFVTGDKEDIYNIAKSYFVNVSPDSLAPGGFLHSEYFVLIDKEGRVRSGTDKSGNVVGVYDGTNEAQIKDLIKDVKVLMAEYHRPPKTKRKW